MKNTLYNINGIYGVIRDYYIANFPHKIEFHADNALNAHVRSKNENAFIVKNEKGYEFSNPTPYQLSDDSFSRSFEVNIVSLEKYLSEENNLTFMFQDVNALNKWLEDSGFVKNGVATEKMLATKTL
ncbi:hypothetical protein IG611_00400 [Pectobacterium sp. A535-S3-A17]|uniref:hypothetical protein n=1 Tax=Pectobacterium quasiaquaticum TaxID=2774015 RepID=UPI0018744E58|nr:hypothetical protein [Pectobacterium quasiaquaticum]MBE5213498.1 hypothetical protein [Pectobacterium quasiaquaticum]MBE5223852.1 hypothetical protein [Pectobacterium quasiaquaticum]